MSESSRGRGKKVVAPRGRGRRTAEEREQILRAERERNQERDRQYAQEQNAARIQQERADRDRRRREDAAARGRGRGRGGFMGDGLKHESSGPLSMGSAISASVGQGKAFPRPWAPSKRPGGSRSASDIETVLGSGGGGGGGGGSSSRAMASEFATIDGSFAGHDTIDGGYISSDLEEDEAGPRREITTINLVSDDEDGERESFGGPVFMERLEHRDRGVQINTDAGDAKVKTEDEDETMTDAPDAAVKGKAKARDKDLEVVSERPFQGVWRPEPEVKEESQAEDPVTHARGQPKDRSGADEDDEARRRRPRQVATKEPQFFTEEERKEYERLQLDAATRLAEFSDPARHKEGNHTYLFQFPPVLPSLIPQAPITIKDDPDAPAPAATTTGGASSTTVPIKVEDDDNQDPLKPTPTADATIRPSYLPTLSPGSVGKMRVHKSGKVTMDWGGTPLVMQNAVEAKFLQTLVMLKMDESRSAVALPSQVVGQAVAFGQPRGKFVVLPDWDVLMPDKDGGRKVKAESA